MKKMFLISIAVLFVIGLALSSDAAVKKKSTGMSGGMSACDGDCCMDGPHMKKLEALGLDEKQKEAVAAIHLRTKKDMIKNRADKQIAEIELKELLSKDPVDLKAAEATIKKIEGMESEMKMSHIKAMEEIKSNLNPEQKKKFISTMGMGMGMCMGRMGHGTGMQGKCNMHCMDNNMDNMDEMEHAPHGDKTPPMQHKHH